MDVRLSSFQSVNISSLKAALNMNMLQKAMNQDAESVNALLKAMEQSVTPHLGQNVDIKL